MHCWMLRTRCFILHAWIHYFGVQCYEGTFVGSNSIYTALVEHKADVNVDSFVAWNATCTLHPTAACWAAVLVKLSCVHWEVHLTVHSCILGQLTANVQRAQFSPCELRMHMDASPKHRSLLWRKLLLSA